MQDVVDLFRNFKKYDSMSDADLRLYLMPSFNLRQCKKFYDGDELIGFVNWAYIHDITEKRFKASGKIKPMMRWVYNNFKDILHVGESINWLRTNSDIYRVGKKFKREFHA